MNKELAYLNKITEEMLSPKQFIRLSPEEKVNISFTEVIPPRLGEKDFGKLKVHYKRPVYK